MALIGYLEGQKAGKEEKDNSSQHYDNLAPAPGDGGWFTLARLRSLTTTRTAVTTLDHAPRMLGHCHVGCQVAGDDGIQQHQHTQRQPEENTDDCEEESFGPRRVYICGASWADRIIFVLSNGQHW